MKQPRTIPTHMLNRDISRYLRRAQDGVTTTVIHSDGTKLILKPFTGDQFSGRSRTIGCAAFKKNFTEELGNLIKNREPIVITIHKLQVSILSLEAS